MRTRYYFNIYTLLIFSALNIIGHQNCSKQVFEKPEIDPTVKVKNCNELDNAVITMSPEQNLQINQNVRFTVNERFFNEISWEFFYQDTQLSALSTQTHSPTIQFQNYGNYRVKATLTLQLEDSEEICVKPINKLFSIVEVVSPPPSGCFNASDTQNGTASLPWQISTCECLQAIETNPGDSQKNHHFSISSNLNCQDLTSTGEGFTSIKYFNGHIEGNNKNVINLRSERINASVFYGDFNGSIKNITFQNLRLVSTAANSDAAFHLVNRSAIYSHEPITAQNIQLQNVYIEAGYHASGFAERVIGNLSEIKVSGIVKGKVASGITREVYSLRAQLPSTQFSILNNVEFNGTLSGDYVAGIAILNLGEIRNSKSNITVQESKENLQFAVAGLAITNCAGAIIDSSESSGTVNLDYDINENSLRAYLFGYGALVGTNGHCSASNGFDSIMGVVTNSRSSITANISITRAAGSNNEIRANVGELIGYSYGTASNNVYTGQLNYTSAGF